MWGTRTWGGGGGRLDIGCRVGMVMGAPGGGIPGTQTYVPQNDPLVTLIILNTHMWGFQNFTHWGSGPSSQIWGGGGLRGEGQG